MKEFTSKCVAVQLEGILQSVWKKCCKIKEKIHSKIKEKRNKKGVQDAKTTGSAGHIAHGKVISERQWILFFWLTSGAGGSKTHSNHECKMILTTLGRLPGPLQNLKYFPASMGKICGKGFV